MVERRIDSTGVCTPGIYITNKINNKKYTFLSFLPKFFYNEYKYFCNLYFLLIALSQFFEPLKVGLMITYVFPVVLLFCISLLKELWDEYKRAKKDKVLNSEYYE